MKVKECLDSYFVDSMKVNQFIKSPSHVRNTNYTLLSSEQSKNQIILQYMVIALDFRVVM